MDLLTALALSIFITSFRRRSEKMILSTYCTKKESRRWSLFSSRNAYKKKRSKNHPKGMAIKQGWLCTIFFIIGWFSFELEIKNIKFPLPFCGISLLSKDKFGEMINCFRRARAFLFCFPRKTFYCLFLNEWMMGDFSLYMFSVIKSTELEKTAILVRKNKSMGSRCSPLLYSTMEKYSEKKKKHFGRSQKKTRFNCEKTMYCSTVGKVCWSFVNGLNYFALKKETGF